MPEDRSAERDLDRFWNDLVAGNPPTDDGRLDPDVAEAVRLFQDHATAPQPRASRERVSSRIDAEIDRLEHRRHANGRVHWAAVGAANDATARDLDRLPWITPSRASGSGRRPLMRTAAFAVAVLVIGFVALGVWRDWRSASDDRTKLPAVAPPATAIPGVSERELVEVRIPAEAVPAGRASAGLQHLTLPPGVRTMSAHGHGAHLRYVLSGALAVRAGGTAQVLRAGSGSWEPIPTDAEVTLGAGEAVLFLDPADVAFANPGAVPAEVLDFGLANEAAGGLPADMSDWIVNDYAQTGRAYRTPGEGIVLPGGPAVLRLARAVLEPRASLPAAPVDRFRLAVAVPDNGLGTPVAPNLAMPPDGRVGNLGTTSIAVYGVTLEIPGAAGTPLAAGAEP